MEWINTFRSSAIAQRLASDLQELQGKPIRLMEVCGTHTVAIAHNGIRQLMPESMLLTSGPGCPVCVTATAEIDAFIAAARLHNTIITTFGDLLKVPGTESTLKQEMADGADVRIVYSPLDAVQIARENPDREVVFLGVGFETTTPTVAAAILAADTGKIKNFSVLSAHKLMPPALEALISDPEVRIDGLLCPGHVSIMIGAEAYRPFAERYNIPCVIAGFEPVDILHGIVLLARQLYSGKQAKVEIAYERAVCEKGNPRAMDIMFKVFEPIAAQWRGLGEIPQSGLAIRAPFAEFDAFRRLTLTLPPSKEPPGCQCGKVLKGILAPRECKLFGKICTPEKAIGPCMVSSEGACAASYRYGG